MPTATLEPQINARQRIWPIGAWLVILAVVGWAGVVGGRLYQRDQNLKESAQAYTNPILLKRHWQILETQADFRAMIDQLSHDFDTKASNRRWDAKIISYRTAAGVLLDRFEAEALAKIQAGSDEVWQPTWSGKPRYARAVRAAGSCMPCHRSTASGSQIQENDIIAIVSLELKHVTQE